MEQDLSKKPGAGIVIVKYFDGIPKILGLMDDDAYDLKMQTQTKHIYIG